MWFDVSSSLVLLTRGMHITLELFQQVYDSAAFACQGKILVALLLGVKCKCMDSGALPNYWC